METIKVHAKTEVFHFTGSDVRLQIIDQYGVHEMRVHGDTGRFVVEAVAAANRAALANAQAAPGGVVDERAAFEADMHAHGFWSADMVRTSDGLGYRHKHVVDMWTGWQARAALAQRAGSGEPVGTMGVFTGAHDVQWEHGRIPAVGAKLYTAPQPLPVLTDEQIDRLAETAFREGRLSWTGFKEDAEGKFMIPVLSRCHLDLFRVAFAAVGAAPGSKEGAA